MARSLTLQLSHRCLLHFAVVVQEISMFLFDF